MNVQNSRLVVQAPDRDASVQLLKRFRTKSDLYRYMTLILVSLSKLISPSLKFSGQMM